MLPYLECGRWQVGYRNILQVVLQRVDKRGDGELQRVFVLKHNSVEQKERRLLHADCGARKAEANREVRGALVGFS